MGINEVNIVQGDDFYGDVTVRDRAGDLFDVSDYTVLLGISKGIITISSPRLVNKPGSIVNGPNGLINVALTSSETSILSAGSYKYDVQIKSSEGKVYTVIIFEDFNVKQSIAPPV